MNQALVRCEVDTGLATVTLDSPGNRNALSRAMIDQLQAVLADAADDDRVRAILLTHTGGTFCAGIDLREALSAGMEQTSVRLLALLRDILAHPKPVLALVDGHVRAGGLGVMAACDLVVAGSAATFAFTEARLALAPAIISVVTSPRMISRAAGRYYLTGETFDAREAERIGLITLAEPNPWPAVNRLVESLLLAAPQGLAESKKRANEAVLAGLDRDGERMAALSAGLFGSQAAREGMAAFTERRAPNWVIG